MVNVLNKGIGRDFDRNDIGGYLRVRPTPSSGCGASRAWPENHFVPGLDNANGPGLFWIRTRYSLIRLSAMTLIYWRGIGTRWLGPQAHLDAGPSHCEFDLPQMNARGRYVPILLVDDLFIGPNLAALNQRNIARSSPVRFLTSAGQAAPCVAGDGPTKSTYCERRHAHRRATSRFPARGGSTQVNGLVTATTIPPPAADVVNSPNSIVFDRHNSLPVRRLTAVTQLWTRVVVFCQDLVHLPVGV
jgi:hypothetical protein